jgi:hypothetical protein
MDPSFGCCFGCTCSAMYCPKSGARLREKIGNTADPPTHSYGATSPPAQSYGATSYADVTGEKRILLEKIVRPATKSSRLRARPPLRAFRTATASLLFVVEVYFPVGDRDFAAFDILFGFHIADLGDLGFALVLLFFVCLRLLAHMNPSVDNCCLGCTCSQRYCPESGARLRGNVRFVPDRNIEPEMIAVCIRQSSRTRGRLRQHARRVRYPFGAREATIFSKRGSPRSGSQNGSSFRLP